MDIGVILSDISIKLNTRTFFDRLKKFKKKHESLVTATLVEITGIAKVEAKKRVPKKTGRLERNIVAKVYRKQRYGIVKVRRHPVTDVYASFIHNGTYNLGERSRRKEGLVGVKVGNRFLTRALMDNRKKFKRIIKKRLG